MPHPDKTYPGVVSALDVLNEGVVEKANAGAIDLYGLVASGTGATVIIKPTGVLDAGNKLRTFDALTTGALVRVKDDTTFERLVLPMPADLGGTGIDATGGGDALASGVALHYSGGKIVSDSSLIIAADQGGTGIDATAGPDALSADAILRYDAVAEKLVSDANYLVDSANENFGLGSGVTMGSGATRTISLKTGVEPATGPADTVQLSSVESVSGGTILCIRTDGGIGLQTGQPDAVSTRRVRIKIDGVEVSLLAE